MERNLSQLGGTEFDVLIIGGGIYGVYTAWDAALRGLTVAIIEKSDFGSATSSNSLKIIHGGLRYLQHADFKRMRESITERTTLMRIAPHLVHPLPCVMPTYGHSIKGKEVMAIALMINDFVGFDRNSGLPPEKHLPRGKVISKNECLAIIPGLKRAGLSGGALWYDCQVHNSERMLLSILHAAVAAGSVAANYVEMVGFLRNKDRVIGVKAKDTLSGEDVEILSKLVVNCSGPWINQILSSLNGYQAQTHFKMSAAMNLVVKKKIFNKYAVGLWSKSEFKDKDAVISKGSRLYFITPWKNYSLIGTTHAHYKGEPSQFKITEKDIQEFVDDVKHSYPAAGLRREDVSFYYGGLLPVDDSQTESADVQLLKSYQIIDHKLANGLDGLISVVSVKYTTARFVAQKAVDYVFKKLGSRPAKCKTNTTPIIGGDMENFEKFLAAEKTNVKEGLSPDRIEHLVRNYGTQYERVLRYGLARPELFEVLNGSFPVLKAEIVYAVQEEMACNLVDVIRRRTELGAAECPDELTLAACAQLMAEERGWSELETRNQIKQTQAIYQPAK